MNHEQRATLQHAINNVDQKLDVESKYCVPRLADKTQKQGMILTCMIESYDEFRFRWLKI